MLNAITRQRNIALSSTRKRLLFPILLLTAYDSGRDLVLERTCDEPPIACSCCIFRALSLRGSRRLTGFSFSLFEFLVERMDCVALTGAVLFLLQRPSQPGARSSMGGVEPMVA